MTDMANYYNSEIKKLLSSMNMTLDDIAEATKDMDFSSLPLREKGTLDVPDGSEVGERLKPVDLKAFEHLQLDEDGEVIKPLTEPLTEPQTPRIQIIDDAEPSGKLVIKSDLLLTAEDKSKI
jgi:hypothetical protein